MALAAIVMFLAAAGAALSAWWCLVQQERIMRRSWAPVTPVYDLCAIVLGASSLLLLGGAVALVSVIAWP